MKMKDANYIRKQAKKITQDEIKERERHNKVRTLLADRVAKLQLICKHPEEQIRECSSFPESFNYCLDCGATDIRR